MDGGPCALRPPQPRDPGLIETSWALGLLIGVTLLGLVAAVASWRWSYVVGAVAVVAMAGVLSARLECDTPGQQHRAAPPSPTARLDRAGWAAVVGMLGLTAAAQSLFVTFGACCRTSSGSAARRWLQ